MRVLIELRPNISQRHFYRVATIPELPVELPFGKLLTAVDKVTLVIHQPYLGRRLGIVRTDGPNECVGIDAKINNEQNQLATKL